MSSNCAKRHRRASAFKLYLDELLDGYNERALEKDESLTGVKLFIAAKNLALTEFEAHTPNQKAHYQRMADKQNEENGVAPELYINAVIARHKRILSEEAHSLYGLKLHTVAKKQALAEFEKLSAKKKAKYMAISIG